MTARFTQADVTRAIKGAKKAGAENFQVKLRPDCIEIKVGPVDPDQLPPVVLD